MLNYACFDEHHITNLWLKVHLEFWDMKTHPFPINICACHT
jgi:hypothetical protein